MESAAPHLARSSIPLRNFEGLCAAARPLSPELLVKLRAAGFDPESTRDEYPVGVWRDVLEILRRARFPALDEEAGYRALGKEFAWGLASTPVWQAIVAGQPQDPFRIMANVPRYCSVGRNDLRVVAMAETQSSWRVECEDPYPLPSLLAGMIEESLKNAGAAARVDIVRRADSRYTLAVRW